VVRRIALLVVGGAITLMAGVVGAVPAFADNGPHVSTSGSSTVDRCAGCHRAHTAQAPYLLKAADTMLCESCHGPGGTGASTDVIDGVGYNLTSPGVRGTTAGALRGGGFSFALLSSGTATLGSTTGIVPVGAAAASTSKHNIDATGTAWGGGATGNGSSVALTCTSCHDPHGNGNYRILRPVADGGAALTYPAPAAVTSVTQTGVSGTTYTYDVVTAAANTFKVTNPVTFVGTTGGGDVLIGANITAVTDTTHFSISIRSVNAPNSTGGTVYYANPSTVVSATGDGTNVTYRTAHVHGLAVGSKVTITGFTPAGYNVTVASVVSVPSTTTFTVANTTTAAATVLGSITGIPDAAGTKVYTTTNYWATDDHNYSGANVVSGAAPTAFIANISQWCSTCHTRLLTGSGSYKTDSGDATYQYMHRSNNGKEGSPNCIQCHVAHGTNASVAGDGTTVYSSLVTNPDGSAGDSYLLRVDNRGTCNMCHKK
jgi:predicted CXXCH cytochrome family protein